MLLDSCMNFIPSTQQSFENPKTHIVWSIKNTNSGLFVIHSCYFCFFFFHSSSLSLEFWEKIWRVRWVLINTKRWQVGELFVTRSQLLTLFSLVCWTDPFLAFPSDDVKLIFSNNTYYNFSLGYALCKIVNIKIICFLSLSACMCQECVVSF